MTLTIEQIEYFERDGEVICTDLGGLDGYSPISDHGDELRALCALAKQALTQEWKDISSAPKDGTQILAWYFEGCHVLNWYDLEDGEGHAWIDGAADYFPEHLILGWKPLPPPPTTGEQS